MTESVEYSNSYFLGVDGGGSKTLAVIVDAQGHECGRGRAGGANYHNLGLEQAISNIREAAEKAARAAACHLPLQSAWLGISSVDDPNDHELLYPHLRPLASTVQVTNDVDLVLSGLDGSLGVALIAGTGSIASGHDKNGTVARASGWGYLLGDEGGGYDLGRSALVASLRAVDGRAPRTMLLDLILQHWDLKRPGDILSQIYPTHERARVAALTVLLFKAYCAGDQVAREIVRRGAEELALAVIAVGQQLDFGQEAWPLALGGSLLLHESIYRELVLEKIQAKHPVGQLALVTEPALSAARACIQEQ